MSQTRIKREPLPTHINTDTFNIQAEQLRDIVLIDIDNNIKTL